MVRRFWRSDLLLVWLQYIAAGIAMIPAGVLYLILLQNMGSTRAIGISCLIAAATGLAVRSLVGHFLGGYFLHSQPVASASNELAVNEIVQSSYLEHFALAGAYAVWSSDSTPSRIQRNDTTSLADSYTSCESLTSGSASMMAAG